MYGAIVFSNGVLRSISKSGGVAAHAHVGDGHDSVYGTDWSGACRRGVMVEKERKVRMHGARARDRRKRLMDIVCWVVERKVE